MTFMTAALLVASLLTQQKPPAKPKGLADEAVVVEREGLDDVVAVSKDGKTLALIDAKTSAVLLYDPKTFRLMRTLEGINPPINPSYRGTGGRGSYLSFSPDSKLIVACRRGDEYKTFPVWEVATGKLLAKLPAFPKQSDSIGFSPTGKEIFAAGYEAPRQLMVKCWSTELVKGQINPTPTRTFELKGNLVDIVLDPAGTKMYCYASEKGYVLTDALTGAELETVENAERGTFYNSGYKFELSPDAKLLAVATAKAGTDVQGKRTAGLLRIWDLETKAVALDLHLPTTAWYMAFSLDGKIVAVSCYEVLNVYEVATGTLLRSVEKKFVQTFAFDPTGTWIYNPTSEGLRVWRVKKP
jgi:WD40 repeat protein